MNCPILLYVTNQILRLDYKLPEEDKNGESTTVASEVNSIFLGQLAVTRVVREFRIFAV
jgi:hypothetical protein